MTDQQELHLKAGDPAPDFELLDQHRNTVRLSDYRGQKLLMYFYPKADTPGCTKQACGVRDHSADYEAANALVLGISPDPVGELKKFHDNHALGFPLLCDEGHAVAEASPPDGPADPFGLTTREREVLELVAEGYTNRRIADTLFISESTAGVHVSHILAKLGVETRTEAAAVAVRLGLDLDATR